jgi:hypothetical protein
MKRVHAESPPSQAWSLLSAPRCGCKPDTVGFEAIALGRCCETPGDSGSGKERSKVHDAPRKATCEEHFLTADSAAAGNPDTTPPCCA